MYMYTRFAVSRSGARKQSGVGGVSCCKNLILRFDDDDDFFLRPKSSGRGIAGQWGLSASTRLVYDTHLTHSAATCPQRRRKLSEALTTNRRMALIDGRGGGFLYGTKVVDRGQTSWVVPYSVYRVVSSQDRTQIASYVIQRLE